MKVTMVTVADGGKAEDVTVTLYENDQFAWESLYEEFYEYQHEGELPGTYMTWTEFWALSVDDKMEWWEKNVGLDLTITDETVFGSSRT